MLISRYGNTTHIYLYQRKFIRDLPLLIIIAVDNHQLPQIIEMPVVGKHIFVSGGTPFLHYC
jgi:hypothetical protein